MKKFLFLTFLLLNLSVFSQIPKGLDIYGLAAGDNCGISVSLSTDGNTLAMGSSGNDDAASNAGHTRVFFWTGTQWLQKGQNLLGEGQDDFSGWSISLNADGNTIALGAPQNDGGGSTSGHTRIYSFVGNTWIQKGMDIDGEAVGNRSGTSVSLSDDGHTLAIGAPQNSGGGLGRGHVRIYSWNGTVWVQKGLDIDGETDFDHSGTAVSMTGDGNTLAIGAPGNSDNGPDAGQVRVYTWTGSVWAQKGIDLDGEMDDTYFGEAVSLTSDGNTLAIGGSYNDGNGSDAGHTRVYTWNGTIWSQKGQDIDGNLPDDNSGSSVSISDDGNLLAVGVPGGLNVGLVQIYTWNGISWVQIGSEIMGSQSYEATGRAVLLNPSGNTLASGSMANDVMGPSAGVTRVYSIMGVYGVFFNDLDVVNCLQEPTEAGIPGYSGIINPGGIVVTTNADGIWFVDSLPVGSYTLTLDTWTSWSLNCGNSISFSVTNPDSLTQAPSIGLVSDFPCSEPSVSISAPWLRRCFGEQMVYVSACNSMMGTSILENAWVELELPAYMTLDSANLSYVSLGANNYSFQLADTLFPGQCIEFSLSTTVSCDALLEETLCMEARMYPADSCVFDSIPATPSGGVSPCLLPWDKSSLSVNGWCANDTVYFTIENTGDPGGGDMDCFSEIRVFVDGQMIILDSIQLTGGEIDTFVFAGNGQTWHLEADQHPLHPGNSHPNATVELCGDISNWTPGLVQIFPTDDLDPVIDIFCGPVRGSFDPNDKLGVPLGLTEDHFVNPGGQMEYIIRFQNTGTDTAFTVVIRDTLDTDLDVFSVTSGASTHQYDFRTYGPRVLEWRFDNIMLPDSGIDQNGSRGFVSFTVMMNPDLPNGTELTNSSAIYFDYNDPIITNETSHLVCLPGLETVTIDTCDSFIWVDGNTYTSSINLDPVMTFNPDGCYTWTSLDLALRHSNSAIATHMACDSLSWIDGNTYLSSNNTATHIILNAAGCDSIITLDLTITNSTAYTDVQSACDGYDWIDGNTYSNSNNTATHTILNAAGCDSVITLDLTITNSTAYTDVQSACDGYDWIDGNTYSNSNNTATHTILNAAGCDSVITLDLTITNSTSYTDVQSACDSYDWIDGNTYSSSNTTATHTIPNATGCDSILILDLTITALDNTITLSGTSLSANQPNATYQWLDCGNGNNIIVGATGQSYSPAISGSYAVEVNLNDCPETSECMEVTIVGIDRDAFSAMIKVFPNPTNGLVNIELGKSYPGVEVIISTIEGKMVHKGSFGNAQTIDFGFDGPSGLYFLEVRTSSGESAVSKLMKE